MKYDNWFEINRYYADKQFINWNFKYDMFYDDEQALPPNECKKYITIFIYRIKNIITLQITIGKYLKIPDYYIRK